MIEKELSVAVLLACYNRRAKTLECLSALFAQATGCVNLSIYLFDDGSSDGTADAVQAIYPDAVIVRGNGTCYWNRSMHAVFELALAARHQSYLWLNDDTVLSEDALTSLLRAASTARTASGHEAVVVGAIQDPVSGELTYGAGRRVNPRWRPFLYELEVPNGTIQSVDVMNGNCVLVPDDIARKVGNFDPVFEHGMGDTDYALRVRAAGLPIVLTDKYVGSCARNATQGTFRDRSLNLRERVKAGFSRKGLPVKSWWQLCRRHGGLIWPLHFCWAYVRIAIGRY